MTFLHRLASIARWVVHRKKAEQDLSDELEAFVDIAAADRAQNGVPPIQARRQALLYLGGVEQAKERIRSARSGARSTLRSGDRSRPFSRTPPPVRCLT